MVEWPTQEGVEESSMSDSMNICVKCKEEMKCTQTGLICVWGESHCISGDKFECTLCKASIIITAKEGYFCPDILKNEKAKAAGLIINMNPK